MVVLIGFASREVEGKVTSTVKPPPGRGWAVSVARWAAAIASTIARPSPFPLPWVMRVPSRRWNGCSSDVRPRRPVAPFSREALGRPRKYGGLTRLGVCFGVRIRKRLGTSTGCQLGNAAPQPGRDAGPASAVWRRVPRQALNTERLVRSQSRAAAMRAGAVADGLRV